MNIIKLSYLKWRISQPNYYRDRAIQMGETAGALIAEIYMCEDGTKIGGLCRDADRIYRKMDWYSLRAMKRVPTPDYES